MNIKILYYGFTGQLATARLKIIQYINKMIARTKYKRKRLKIWFRQLKKRILSLLRIFIWYLILIALGYAVFRFQRKNLLPPSEYKNILTTLISTIGITTAIIISFLFSKLYSEKTERIERKRIIDKLSKKLTALRKIVHFLLRSFDFWRINNNIKRFLDNKYKRLTLYEYDKMNYDDFKAFHEEVQIGELAAQAYLGLKEIKGLVPSDFVFYDRLLRKNYSLNELAIMQVSCQRMWAFMDEYNQELRDVSSLSVLETKPFKENLKIIYPNFKPEDLNNNTFKNLFNDFPEEFIPEQYYLTQRNRKSFGKFFNALLVDLIFFVVLIISSVFLLSINYSEHYKMLYTNIIVSGFIISVIDLLVNVINSIKKELKITDFY